VPKESLIRFELADREVIEDSGKKGMGSNSGKRLSNFRR
jgi:hypothetical protein